MTPDDEVVKAGAARAYRLVVAGRDYPVGRRCVIGRNLSADIVLDEDPLVSREHAQLVFADGVLWVEDLNSANGVMVGETPVDGRCQVRDGDVLMIGSSRLTVRQAGARQSERTRRAGATTMRARLPVADTRALELLATVVDKALSLGNVAEAERILGPALDQQLVAVAAQRGFVSERQRELITSYALRVAEAARRGEWLERLFEVFRVGGATMPQETVDGVYGMVTKVAYPQPRHLKAYVEYLQGDSARLTAAERFGLRRLEGLVARLSPR